MYTLSTLCTGREKINTQESISTHREECVDTEKDIDGQKTENFHAEEKLYSQEGTEELLTRTAALLTEENFAGKSLQTNLFLCSPTLSQQNHLDQNVTARGRIQVHA